MKRLRSYGDDLDSVGERRDRDRDRDRDRERDRSSSHRRFYSNAENGRNRGIDDDRESSRSSRKRFDYEFDGFDRRKSSDRYRDSSDRGGSVSISSPRNVYGGERIHRSESVSGSRREFGKGYLSERERARREESVSSWRRLSGCKDVEEEYKSNTEFGRGSRLLVDDGVNVRSPQGSREAGRSPHGSREVGRSPQSSRDGVKSPPGTKESSGEQSKGGEVKRSDDVKGGSGSSSEMEEGELEPDPEWKPEPEMLGQPEVEANPPPKRNSKSQDFEPGGQIKMTTNLIEEAKPLPEKQMELGTSDVIGKKGTVETGGVVLKGIDELQECHESSVDGTYGTKETVVLPASEENDEYVRGDFGCSLSPGHAPENQGIKEEINDEYEEKSKRLDEGQKEENGLEVKGEEINFIDYKELAMDENRKTVKTLTLMTETQNGKDKGKSIAVSPSSETDSRNNSQWAEKDLLTCRDDAMEGPSRRGFELFSNSTFPRSEKANYCVVSNEGKLKTEPLELSLALPNALLPLPSHDLKAAPSTPGHARSVQSLPNTFRTNSDGFSGSMSFSGSQTFIHYPSCSLTQNSVENCEQSVGSRPLFQGIDQHISHITWTGKSSDEPKHVEPPIYQRSLSLNGSHPSQTSQGIMYTQAMQGQQKSKLSQVNNGVLVGQDRQSNLHRQLSGLQSKNHNEVRSPTNSTGSRETRSEFSKNKKRIVKERNGSLQRSSSQRDMDQLVIGGSGFVERIITMIVSEPVQVMARRIEEMAEQSIVFLKESAREIIVNKNKRGQLHAFQEALQNRSDLTVEILSMAHRAQLEILVAFKTGRQDFLQRASSIPSSDLAEIYNNLMCRNLACLNPLPVDECDCKVCVQKSGFCSACMCLICSKFDMALNTCSWVGCDVCLHWCHTDCGLRKSHIRNGRNAAECQEATEMQFHCVACNHPSEMFGFVKEVFKTCAKEWNVESLSKELECVKRIFSASNDPRGRQLHVVADQMIARLEIKSNLSEVYNHIMSFLNESDPKSGNTGSTCLKDIPHKHPGGEGSNGVVGPSQLAMWLESPRVESVSSDWGQMGGRGRKTSSVGKMGVVDELESIVRIKHVEAKMFQERADDARKEAEGLKCIVGAKNEKIEEEYSRRTTKLRLAEAEERRKQKLDELKVVEREQREYLSLKMRMESDIRVLLLKMEAMKRNYAGGPQSGHAI